MERKRRRLRHALAAALLAVAPAFPVFADDTTAQVRAGADRVEQQLIAWRHDLHRNPELSNRELRTARLVADCARVAPPALTCVKDGNPVPPGNGYMPKDSGRMGGRGRGWEDKADRGW